MLKDPAKSFARRSDRLARLWRTYLSALDRRKAHPTERNCRRAEAALARFARAS